MNAWILYIIKSTALLSVFFAFFLLVMRRSSFFRFNRIALLGGAALCMLLPLVPVHTATPNLYAVLAAANVFADGGPASGSAAIQEPVQAGIGITDALLLLYIAGAAVVLLLTIISYIRLLTLLHATPWQLKDGCRLHLVERDAPSLSWANNIVMSRSDFEKFPAMFSHESAHVHCGHSWDLMLFSLLTVLQWFNPLVWICRTELKLLHEYEADEHVINQGIDATQYQLLLVKKAVGEKRFLLANGFNHSQLKNRIKMMQNTPSAAWKKLSLLLVLPFLAGVTILFAENSARSSDALPQEPVKAAVSQDSAQIEYSEVEVKPTFNGGDAGQFAKWVGENLIYPQDCAKEKIQGRVMVQFTINAEGKVVDAKVLRGVDERLDREALRVISASPKWTPGKVKGKAVAVTFTCPVMFALR